MSVPPFPIKRKFNCDLISSQQFTELPSTWWDIYNLWNAGNNRSVSVSKVPHGLVIKETKRNIDQNVKSKADFNISNDSQNYLKRTQLPKYNNYATTIEDIMKAVF